MASELSPEEEHIIDESPEISVGESPVWVQALGTAFPALGNRNYQLYFSGQLVSLIGTWLQIVAQGWLVLKLTNSALLIGLVAAMATLPSLLFTLHGGVIVDRFPKRRILIFTQVSAMVLAFILGVLTLLNFINVWEISILAFLLGAVNALDAPARQAFVPEMVGVEQLPSAIALNSAAFNMARIIGPGVAGVLIATVGTGGAFMLNGISYIAVIVALFQMRVTEVNHPQKSNALQAIREGFVYSFTHPIIRMLIIFAGVGSVFGWSYTTDLPLIAQNEFHLGASGLGYMYAATGIGSLLSAFLIAFFSKRFRPMVFIGGGSLIFAISIILFSFTHSLKLALPLLAMSGLGLLGQFAMMNTRIQSLVKPGLRGRVMSIYVFMFVGLTPLGNFEVGWVSEKFGTMAAIRWNAVVVILFALYVISQRNKMRASYKEYAESEN